MSWVYFNRNTRSISLIKGTTVGFVMADLQVYGSWNAHNDVASKSNGPWPVGLFKYSHYNAHAEQGLAPGCFHGAYGCNGIHVFDVPGRSGMGIHAGRTNGAPDILGGKTLGCIRIPPNAMEMINKINRIDPIKFIYVIN